MATLTWRDVAGGGYGGGGGRYNQGSSDQLMEGIKGFNEALDAIVNRRNNRALHDIENRLALNNLAAEHQQSQSAALQDVITAQDQALDTAAEAEWNRVSGSLLDSAYRAGADPTLPDPLQSEAFRNLSPRAQALGSALMAEQAIAGKEFGSEDAARRASADIARRNLAVAEARERREAEAARLAQENARDPLEGVDPASRERLRGLQQRSATDLARYRGDEYADLDITTDKRVDTANLFRTWGNVEARLEEEGYFDTPLGVLKRFVAETGQDKGRDAEDALYRMALAYHRADRLHSLVTGEVASAYGNPEGYRISDGKIQEMLTEARNIRPKVRNSFIPTTPPKYDPREFPLKFGE